MSKVLITADLHIHPHRNDQRRTEDGLQCLQWIYDTAAARNLETVIVAGDFLHHRYSLNTYAYAKACKIVADRKRAGINTIFLLGNHDMFHENQWDVHSLAPLMEWSKVVDSPTTLDIHGIPVDFLPYTPLPSKYIDGFETPSKTLISHLSVAEAILNKKYDVISVEDDTKEKEVIQADAFKKWKKVWLGHYHYGQKVNRNVEYVGSPMQLTYGEAGQKKHVAIYDLATLKTEYVDNEISPRFHIVEDPDEIDGLAINNGYIQVRAKGPIANKFELKKKLSKLGVRESEIIPASVDIAKQTTKAMKNITSFLNDRTKLIEQYVDGVKLDPTLDADLMKKIGKEIVSV